MGQTSPGGLARVRRQGAVVGDQGERHARRRSPDRHEDPTSQGSRWARRLERLEILKSKKGCHEEAANATVLEEKAALSVGVWRAG